MVARDSVEDSVTRFTRRALLALGTVTIGACKHAPGPIEPEPEPTPRVAFVEDANVRGWDFKTPTLPAIDTKSGEVVLADRLEEGVMTVPALDLVWTAPSSQMSRRFHVLARDEAYRQFDLEPQEKEPAALAAKVRERVASGNKQLAAAKLRSLRQCAREGGSPCGAKTTLKCAALTVEYFGDELRIAGQSESTKASWNPNPGPPENREACVLEAYFDPPTRTLVALAYTVCTVNPSDACAESATWQTLVLR